ncbi:MAG: YtxH domain-containing protein [bacterium]|nr:YtxH domain-containing protein [bacterium]
MSRNTNTLMAFVLGAAMGGIAALLLAPDKGEVTRRRLREGGSRGPAPGPGRGDQRGDLPGGGRPREGPGRQRRGPPAGQCGARRGLGGQGGLPPRDGQAVANPSRRRRSANNDDGRAHPPPAIAV